MPGFCLNLKLNDLIDMMTYDNRRLIMKCSKCVNGVPAIDLLPRVRYMLNIEAMPTAALSPPSSLFFSQGLLVVPEDMDGTTERIAVLNMSEKAIRIVAGRQVIAEEPQQDASEFLGLKKNAE